MPFHEGLISCVMSIVPFLVDDAWCIAFVAFQEHEELVGRKKRKTKKMSWGVLDTRKSVMGFSGFCVFGSSEWWHLSHHQSTNLCMHNRYFFMHVDTFHACLCLHLCFLLHLLIESDKRKVQEIRLRVCQTIRHIQFTWYCMYVQHVRNRGVVGA